MIQNKSEDLLLIPILDGAEAALLDAFSIKEKHVDSCLLMGWAGYSIFLNIHRQPWFANTRHIHILAGSGNNGGDGYVLAWHILSATTKKVSFWQLSEPGTDDSRYYYNLCRIPELKNFVNVSPLNELNKKSFEDGDVIVDALFGTGLNKPPSLELQKIVTIVNSEKKVIRIAVDIPSGVYANGDFFSHEVFHADYTFSFGSYKIGQLLEPGILHCGELIVNPVGFFPAHSGKAPEKIRDALKLRRKIKSHDLPPLRKASSHKYDNGIISILGGSAGMEGAAIMSARAFLSLGGGLAKIYSLSDDIKRVLRDDPELMIENGKTIETLESDLLTALRNKAKNHTLVIGVGLKETLGVNFWKDLLAMTELNVIIDGSGLQQLLPHAEIIRGHNLKQLILTPHRAEAEKLLGKPITNIRLAALELSSKYKAHVYLKGPGGIIILNNSGQLLEIYLASNHFELSTGGSGDILCGVIANCLARLHSSDALETALDIYLDTAQNTITGNFKSKEFLTPGELIRVLRESVTGKIK